MKEEIIENIFKQAQQNFARPISKEEIIKIIDETENKLGFELQKGTAKKCKRRLFNKGKSWGKIMEQRHWNKIQAQEKILHYQRDHCTGLQKKQEQFMKVKFVLLKLLFTKEIQP